MRIDTHTHLFPEKLCPQTIEKLAKTDPKHPLDYYGDGSLFCAEANMKKWGIDLGVLLPIATNPKQQKSVNAFAKQVQDNSNAFISFGSLHPKDEAFEETLDELVAMGLYGIKLHPDYQGFFINDKAMYSIYAAISERKLPVVFHTGYDPISPGCVHAEPKAVVEVAKAFPHLVIIAAHTGGLCYDDGPKTIYETCPNVYFDTAIASDTFTPEAYRGLIDFYGAQRFLFATDNPWGSGEKDQAFMANLGLSALESEAIFHKNAQKLLGLEG